jgi:hypothetical protein
MLKPVSEVFPTVPCRKVNPDSSPIRQSCLHPAIPNAKGRRLFLSLRLRFTAFFFTAAAEKKNKKLSSPEALGVGLFESSPALQSATWVNPPIATPGDNRLAKNAV